MKRIVTYLFFITAVVAIVASCSTTQYSIHPNETDTEKLKADYPGITLPELQAGFDLYKINCSGCHFLYTPREKTRQQWEQVLNEMFARTTLNAEQKELVRKYLFSKAS